MSVLPMIDGTKGDRLELKPDFGSPWNECGYCCATEPCTVAQEYIPDHPE